MKKYLCGLEPIAIMVGTHAMSSCLIIGLNILPVSFFLSVRLEIEMHELVVVEKTQRRACSYFSRKKPASKAIWWIETWQEIRLSVV